MIAVTQAAVNSKMSTLGRGTGGLDDVVVRCLRVSRRRRPARLLGVEVARSTPVEARGLPDVTERRITGANTCPTQMPTANRPRSRVA
jgi:hypothetical protein